MGELQSSIRSENTREPPSTPGFCVIWRQCITGDLAVGLTGMSISLSVSISVQRTAWRGTRLQAAAPSQEAGASHRRKA